MSVFEYKLYTKKRSNSKIWDLVDIELKTERWFYNIDAKNLHTELEYLNVDSIEEVKQFLREYNIITIGTLGLKLETLDFNKLLELKETAKLDHDGKMLVIYRVGIDSAPRPYLAVKRRLSKVDAPLKLS